MQHASIQEKYTANKENLTHEHGGAFDVIMI